MSSFQRLLFVLFSVTFLVGCKNGKEDGPIIATVGDATLTLNELLREFPDHIKGQLSSVEIREFVLLWINDQVLYQEALARNIDKKAKLQREFEKLRRELVINDLLDMTIDRGNVVAEEEITAYYEANRESFVLSEAIVRANHVLLASQAEANKVRSRLRGGESFEAISETVYADSNQSIDYDLGYFTRNDVIPEIANIVFKMNVNSLSYPIKSEFGYHILQLVDKQKKGDVKRLETVRDEIRHKILTKKKQDKYQRFLLQMKSKFKIQTNFQLLDSAIMDSVLSNGEKIAHD